MATAQQALTAIIARILEAAESLTGIVPIKEAVEALVGAVLRTPHAPKKDDGSDYKDDELIAVIATKVGLTHEAWHRGDQPSE